MIGVLMQFASHRVRTAIEIKFELIFLSRNTQIKLKKKKNKTQKSLHSLRVRKLILPRDPDKGELSWLKPELRDLKTDGGFADSWVSMETGRFWESCLFGEKGSVGCFFSLDTLGMHDS